MACGNEENECYVDTYEVLGERNLRVKKSIKCIQAIINSIEINEAAQYLKKLNDIVKVSHPSKNYQKFEGKINIRSPKPDLISYRNLIVRGEIIINSSWILGMIVYTGSETKVYKNSQPVSKTSRFDRKLNQAVSYLFLFATVVIVLQFLIGYYIGNQHLKDSSI